MQKSHFAIRSAETEAYSPGNGRMKTDIADLGRIFDGSPLLSVQKRNGRPAINTGIRWIYEVRIKVEVRKVCLILWKSTKMKK